MKKTAIVLISIVALSMLLMAVAPVMAKPNVVTVIVKDATGKPVSNVWVRIMQWVSPTAGYYTQAYQTNSRGKVSISLPITFTNTYYSNEVLVGPSVPPSTVCGTFDLNPKLSARVTVTYPPAV